MEPKIVFKDEIKVVGMQYVGTNPDEIGKMWGEFSQRVDKIKSRINNNVFFGLNECTCKPNYVCNQHNDISYVVCVEVKDFNQPPSGMVTRTIPASRYAVFTHKGSLDTLSTTYTAIYSKWLHAAGLQPSDNFNLEYYGESSEYTKEATRCSGFRFGFECYDERFKLGKEDSEVDIYVPVK
jgi:AraC family transcriptional regulator